MKQNYPGELSFLKRQLQQHTKNLDRLKEQLVLYGAGDAPLRLLNQIEAEQKKIEAFEDKIILLTKTMAQDS